MKKIFLALSFLLCIGTAFSQAPTREKDSTGVVAQAQTEAVQAVAGSQEIVLNGVDSLLCVTIKGERSCIPTSSLVILVDNGGQIVEKYKEDPPKTPMEWALFIFMLVTGPIGTAIFLNGKKAYQFFSIFFKKTINIVAFVSGVLALVITYIIGKVAGGGFEWSIFAISWPIVTTGAVFFYENVLKKPLTPPLTNPQV